MTLGSTEQLNSDLVLYQSEDGNICIEVHLRDEIVWPNQIIVFEPFQKNMQTTNGYIQKIHYKYKLEHHATIRKFRILSLEESILPTRKLRYEL